MSLDVVPRGPRFARTLLPLGVASLALGVSAALAMPFLALFLSTEIHADPVQVTLFLVLSPLAGVLVSTLVGWVSDQRPVRRALVVVTSVAGVVSAGMTVFVRDYWILLGLTLTVTALSGALYPQLFAYAREALSRDDPGRAAMGISSLRTVFAVAWVAGPPLGAFLLEAGGFRYVYGMATALFAVAALVAILALDEIGSPAVPATPADPEARDVRDGAEASRRTLVLTTAAFTMLQCPLTLGLQALPLFIGADLGGDPSDAGFILGLCAALEIPLMLGLGLLTARVPLRLLVLAGAGCGVAYYSVAAAASSVWVLVAAQVVNAGFIAAVSSLGISYMQDLLPRHPGQATTLFMNSYAIGAVLSGPLLGLSQQFSFRLAYAFSTGLCLLGLLCLLVARSPVAAGPPARARRPESDRFDHADRGVQPSSSDG